MKNRKTDARVAPSREDRGKMPLPTKETAVDVSIACDGDIPDTGFIERWVGHAVSLASSNDRATEVSVRVVDADECHMLNRDYRQRDYATNVLSFPTGEIAGLPEEAALTLGDIVVCADVVAVEATEQGKALEDRWAHMLVHGTLHLLGHDHETEEEALAMESLEVRILAEAGVGDPYE